ncbi:MAG: hypothetical protein ACR2JB_07955 [Bryobacteraceae bacterium]
MSRIIIAVLSILGSLAGTVLTQLRLYELWRLREDVDPQFQKVVEEGHRRAAACSSNAQCSDLHKEFLEQHNSFVERRAIPLVRDHTKDFRSNGY